MGFSKNAKVIFLTLILVGTLFSITYAKDNKVISTQSSLGAVNYYELKPSEYFVSLGVKGYQQTTTYTCGPAAAMSLLHWYNKISDANLNNGTEMRIAQEMNTGSHDSSHPGTTLPAIVTWLETNGFDVTWGFNGSLEMVRENLNKGIPTMVEWSDWGGHWVVVTGYYAGSKTSEKGRDTIFLADSGTNWTNVNNPDGITSFNADRFYYMWYDALYSDKITKGIYITAVPHKK